MLNMLFQSSDQFCHLYLGHSNLISVIIMNDLEGIAARLQMLSTDTHRYKISHSKVLASFPLMVIHVHHGDYFKAIKLNELKPMYKVTYVMMSIYIGHTLLQVKPFKFYASYCLS